MRIECSLQSIYQSHPPCLASPGRGSLTYDRGAKHRIARVRFKNWDINSLSRQLFAALHLHAIALFWARVLAVVDLPSAFRLPLFELVRSSYALEKSPFCIRKSSYPKCIGFTWISPALRILSVVLFNDVDWEEFIFCAVSFRCRSPWCSLKPVLLRVDHHQVLEHIVWHSHVLQDQEIWDMLPSVLRSVVQLWASLAKLCVVAEVAPGRSCWASQGW